MSSTTTPSQELDISTMAVSDTTKVELLKPNGDPLLQSDGVTPITVTVYGPGSKQFAKAQAMRNRAVLNTVARGSRRMKDSEQREVDAVFLATCTASFNGFNYKGKPNNEHTFKEAYMDHSIGFIAEQVNKTISDWAAFTPASVAS